MVLLLSLLALVGMAYCDLHIFYEGWSPRTLQNASLGLDHSELHAHQCSAIGERRHPSSSDSGSSALLGYTPNRRAQPSTLDDSINERLQLAFVLALGAHQDGVYNYGEGGSMNGLLSVWDSWVENFFSVTSNTTSLILVLDERDFLKQNHTHSKARYMDILAIDNLGATPVKCIHHRMKKHASSSTSRNNVFHSGVSSFRKHVRIEHPHGGGVGGSSSTSGGSGGGGGNDGNVHKHSKACGNVLKLDNQYQVYSLDLGPYTNTTNQAPLLIFVTVYAFPVPEWARDQEEDTLYVHWRPKGLPPRFNTNYGYTKMTNWYSYHMLQLSILDFFDYAGKLDNDVSFVKTFPAPNLPYKMVSGQHKMLVTQQPWYYDDPRIAQGVFNTLYTYIDRENARCKLGDGEDKDKLKPAGSNDPTFWESNGNATFRAHFLVYWLGLYTAPEVVDLARYWNNVHPRGMWDYRWGDQQWWPRPIAMYLAESITRSILHYSKIDTDNGRFVIHKAYPRSATVATTRYFSFNGTTRKERLQRYEQASKKYIY